MTTGTPAIGGRLAKAAATAVLLLPASAAAELDCARWLERAFWQEAVAEDVIRCLDAGADVEARADDGRPPLNWAAREGHAGAIRALADTGADVEAKDKDGATPLHLAAWQGHPSAIRALLDAGANAGARTASGNLPADVAAEAVRTHPVFRELEAAHRN